jgi:acetylornithine deacetylase
MPGARGDEVDDGTIRLADREPLSGFGPVAGDFGRARRVLGTHRPSGPATGRRLTLPGHGDVVPEGPRARWTDPPVSGAGRDGGMCGRGAGDRKAGRLAALSVLGAIRAAGFAPAARVPLPSVIEAESTAPGARATRQRGCRADRCLIRKPSDPTVNRAEVGLRWFRRRAAGRLSHAAAAGEGASAIAAAFHLIAALRRMAAA